MDRINSDGIIEVDGKRLFTDGDPYAEEANEGTAINAQFLNGVQEEICSFIEGQGIDLDHEQRSQLTEAVNRKLEPYKQAINKMIAIIKSEIDSGAQIDEIR